MTRIVAGHFRDRGTAHAAYDELIARGFPHDEISVLGRGSDGADLAEDHGHCVEGAMARRLAG
jgi:hypothetical protein